MLSAAIDLPSLRARLGRVGVWLSTLAGQSAAREREAAREIEALGYGSLWFGEGGKEAFSHASLLLEATDEILVGTGIASIYARDPVAMRRGSLSIGDAHPGRFVLGLGVSHAPIVASRGHAYGKPVATMRAYLDAMEATSYDAPPPDPDVPVVLAALRPKMLELAAERTTGAHPYFVPPGHTARARAILGPDRLLVPEQMVLLEEDPEHARATARRFAAQYLRLPNYADNLRWLGYTDDDVAEGGSDRLIDDLVAWGTVADVRERIDAHLNAGADHVPIQPLGSIEDQLRQLRELAPVVVGG